MQIQGGSRNFLLLQEDSERGFCFSSSTSPCAICSDDESRALLETAFWREAFPEGGGKETPPFGAELEIILDPAFAVLQQVHNAGSASILICDTAKNIPVLNFVQINPDGSHQISRHHRDVFPSSAACYRCTDQVNGLICFYHGGKGRSSSETQYYYLHNIATNETLRIPDSRCRGHEWSRYQLGFDPVSKLYKLLRVCVTKDTYDWEILTFGGGRESSWRRISSPGRKGFVEDMLINSICYDGVLYWDHHSSDWGISAFGLSKEKFHIIPRGEEKIKDEFLIRNLESDDEMHKRYNMYFRITGILPDGKVLISAVGYDMPGQKKHLLFI
ncbi:OLC1v1005760C1 [Oldenlandia corymbosa var. corymbosa]|uniref:OLC1v1005760C1 n=1 Tax=Oldenlandia corymbosa var. corymbosa TaxID=529605 RepID=A0AAV1DIS7_OLDCO|nr:OLC1v1005760C1 [Oldenlandia corymbosa var. corymbosa]